jgi:hypothetical protein
VSVAIGLARAREKERDGQLVLEADRRAGALAFLEALRVGELFEAAGLGLARDMGVEDRVEPHAR